MPSFCDVSAPGTEITPPVMVSDPATWILELEDTLETASAVVAFWRLNDGASVTMTELFQARDELARNLGYRAVAAPTI